jgi:hypothetical protein
LISVALAWFKNGDFNIDAGANHGQRARLFSAMVRRLEKFIAWKWIQF